MTSAPITTAVLVAALCLGIPARADSLKIRDMPLAGDYGGRYGHTIVIDGKICRLGNSAGFSAPQGCNYEIRAGTDGDETLHATTSNSGCSADCEPAPVRRGDAYARRAPYFDTPRTGSRLAGGRIAAPHREHRARCRSARIPRPRRRKATSYCSR